MGMFYTNVVLYGPEHQQVAAYLMQRGRVAYVSPTTEKWTVVYDRETEDQDTAILQQLAQDLSRGCACPALGALVHDSDVFLYWLYDRGRLADSYNSCPGYFDPTAARVQPEGGDARKLCAAFQRMNALEQVSRIFQRVEEGTLSDDWSPGFLAGEEIHRELAAALGIPAFFVDIGYDSIEGDDLPEDIDPATFIKCTR